MTSSPLFAAFFVSSVLTADLSAKALASALSCSKNLNSTPIEDVALCGQHGALEETNVGGGLHPDRFG